MNESSLRRVHVLQLDATASASPSSQPLLRPLKRTLDSSNALTHSLIPRLGLLPHVTVIRLGESPPATTRARVDLPAPARAVTAATTTGRSGRSIQHSAAGSAHTKAHAQRHCLQRYGPRRGGRRTERATRALPPHPTAAWGHDLSRRWRCHIRQAGGR